VPVADTQSSEKTLPPGVVNIYHLNCATMHPLCGRVMHGTGGYLSRGYIVSHCLLVETNDGLLLVDTGFGLGDITNPARAVRLFNISALSPLDPQETAARQVARLGFDTEDVRHIVLTHLDLDHSGGLPDFPQAQVHVLAREYEAAMRPQTLRERFTYVPAHWAHGPKWVLHSCQGEQWFGFDCVRILETVPPDVLLIPLHGHTRGHCGVAVQTADRWLLHCGDAYAFHGEHPDHPYSSLALTFVQRYIHLDRDAVLLNQARLRALVRNHADEVDVFCAHDPVELARFREAN
jgi:glyoxylase-like metal-dependent hydrolase (beta-lactamase superfamily II)